MSEDDSVIKNRESQKGTDLDSLSSLARQAGILSEGESLSSENIYKAPTQISPEALELLKLPQELSRIKSVCISKPDERVEFREGSENKEAGIIFIESFGRILQVHTYEVFPSSDTPINFKTENPTIGNYEEFPLGLGEKDNLLVLILTPTNPEQENLEPEERDPRKVVISLLSLPSISRS